MFINIKLTILFGLFVLLGSSYYAQPKPLINEILASNFTVKEDRRRQFDDWLEIKNYGNDAVNLGGMFFTDDPENLTKYKIPDSNPGYTTVAPGGFKLFWMDAQPSQGLLHLTGKLNSKGESIILVDKDGKTILDRIDFPEQFPDISYGRNANNAQQLGFFKKPTPGKDNVGVFYNGVSCTPEIKDKGGFYSEAVSPRVTSCKEAEIFFTADGTKPKSEKGTPWTGDQKFEKTTVFSVIAVEEGKLPSRPVVQTYFIESQKPYPYFSIATDDKILFTSTNPKINVFKEKPINIEMYEVGGEGVMSTTVGMKLVGKAIRNYPQKSIAVRFRAEYGMEKITYKLFPDKPESEYYALLLRNAGNDWKRTLMRDALMHRLVVNKTEIDVQGYRPAYVYINGEFFGIHNLREKLSSHYLISNHGEKKVDFMEFGGLPIRGTLTHYNLTTKFISKSDPLAPNYMDSVNLLIDLDSYLDYQAAEIFYGNTDWPMANMKFWRPAKDGGKWRWILFDTDLAFEKTKRRCPGHHNTLKYALGINNCHLPHLERSLKVSTAYMQNLIKNDEFKNAFISRFTVHLNTTFHKDTVLRIIEEVYNGLKPGMSDHIAKWGTKGGIPSMQNWDFGVEELRTFAKERPDTMMRFIQEEFGLSNPVKITIRNLNAEDGYVEIYKTKLNEAEWAGWFFPGVPLVLKATANPKREFKGWSTGEKEELLTITPGKSDMEIEVKFK